MRESEISSIFTRNVCLFVLLAFFARAHTIKYRFPRIPRMPESLQNSFRGVFNIIFREKDSILSKISGINNRHEDFKIEISALRRINLSVFEIGNVYQWLNEFEWIWTRSNWWGGFSRKLQPWIEEDWETLKTGEVNQSGEAVLVGVKLR
jgi:hypothetical protein